MYIYILPNLKTLLAFGMYVYKLEFPCTITSKINVTPKKLRLPEKLQLTAALCNKIWQQ